MDPVYEESCALCCDGAPGCSFQKTVDEMLQSLEVVMFRDPRFVKFLADVEEKRNKTGIVEVGTFHFLPGEYKESVTLVDSVKLT